VKKYVASCERSGMENDCFDPATFVSDGQGSLWTGIRWNFGKKDGSELLEGREQTCLFHYMQGLSRLLVAFEGAGLTDLWRKFRLLAVECIDKGTVEETVLVFGR
jgi:hypothetical protein